MQVCFTAHDQARRWWLSHQHLQHSGVFWDRPARNTYHDPRVSRARREPLHTQRLKVPSSRSPGSWYNSLSYSKTDNKESNADRERHLIYIHAQAVEYGQYKIRVNSISPGSIATKLMIENTPNLQYTIGNTPLGVLGEPMDVADLAVFLASEKSKWLTGQNLVLDGGITIKGGWVP